MKYIWKQTNRTDDLTVVMVARNLVTLCYPFIEAIISTIPLGCKYLIGVAGNDQTGSILNELAHYLPLETRPVRWACDTEPGWGAVAIGIATQQILEQSPTEYAVNLQACEVYTDSAIEVLRGNHPHRPPGQPGPWELKFRHFMGSMNTGGTVYGYPHAPRVFRRDCKFDRTDAWTPNNYDGGYPHGDGWIHRYGYCHRNTITQKKRNHAALYFDGDPEPQIVGCINMGKQKTWHEGHPPCVEHLINLTDYDVNFSLDYAKNNLLA